MAFIYSKNGTSDIAANSSITAGRVGIGTSSPSTVTHIRASDASGSSSYLAGGTILLVDGTGSSNPARLSITKAGGLSALNFGGTNGSDVGSVQYNDSIGKLGFKTNGTDDRMVIDASGNVGIGSAAPQTKLDVNGSITTSDCTISSAANEYGPYALIDTMDGEGIKLRNSCCDTEFTVGNNEFMATGGRLLIDHDIQVTNHDCGILLRDANDVYWRVKVTTSGTLQVTLN